MAEKLTHSDPFITSTDKHSIYTPAYTHDVEYVRSLGADHVINMQTARFDAGYLTTRVGDVLPLAAARLAHAMLAGKPHKRGKIIFKARVHTVTDYLIINTHSHIKEMRMTERR